MKRMYSEKGIIGLIIQVATSIVLEVLANWGMSFDEEADVLSIANLKVENALRDSLNDTGSTGQLLSNDSED